jgi:hypothetical protein
VTVDLKKKPHAQGRPNRKLDIRFRNSRRFRETEKHKLQGSMTGDNGVALHVGDICEMQVKEGYASDGHGYLLLLHGWTYEDRGNTYEYAAAAWFWTPEDAAKFHTIQRSDWPADKTHFLGSEVFVVHTEAIGAPLNETECQPLHYTELLDFESQEFQPVGNSEGCVFAHAVRGRRSSLAAMALGERPGKPNPLNADAEPTERHHEAPIVEVEDNGPLLADTDIVAAAPDEQMSEQQIPVAANGRHVLPSVTQSAPVAENGGAVAASNSAQTRTKQLLSAIRSALPEVLWEDFDAALPQLEREDTWQGWDVVGEMHDNSLKYTAPGRECNLLYYLRPVLPRAAWEALDAAAEQVRDERQGSGLAFGRSRPAKQTTIKRFFKHKQVAKLLSKQQPQITQFFKAKRVAKPLPEQQVLITDCFKRQRHAAEAVGPIAASQKQSAYPDISRVMAALTAWKRNAPTPASSAQDHQPIQPTAGAARGGWDRASTAQ